MLRWKDRQFNKELYRERSARLREKLRQVNGLEEKTVEDLPNDFKKYYYNMINEEISKVEMAKLLECGRATLYRWIKLYEEV